jgi:2-polyprenyl-3-methyl-5-hydroxy-6-metoxy-1,4-benzoquinol methylase
MLENRVLHPVHAGQVLHPAQTGEDGMLEKVRCNLCGADDTAPLAEIDGFHIVRCRQCGLTYVNPRFAQQTLHEIYTESYYDHDGIKNGQEFYGYDDYVQDEENIKITFAKRLKVIERLTGEMVRLNGANKGQLLDVGCATGFFLDLARSEGWNVVGTEVSSFGARFAQERFGLDVRLGTLRDLCFDGRSFDVVTMWDVIEHVLDPMAELLEVHRVLRDGGLLSIITPDVSSPVARLLGRRWEEYRRVREHVYFFSRHTLTDMLRKAGFEILRMESADKVFYLGPAMQRLKYYAWDGAITQLAMRWVYRLSLDKVRININPFTKMAVYARRVLPPSGRE